MATPNSNTARAAVDYSEETALEAHEQSTAAEATRPLGRGASAEKPMKGGADGVPSENDTESECFNSAEVGALAHLYRGEIYRSTTWRTRLDATTNWSVVSLGIALSISYSSPTASSLPLLLVGVLITVFLFLEARRYRYFNVWRARARWLEINFYAPLLKRESYEDNGRWQNRLAEDYQRPEHHITFLRAFGRRLRRNYLWIFVVQGLAYFGKVMIHPTPFESFAEVLDRMIIGPVPGILMFAVGLGFYATLISITLYVYTNDKARIRTKPNPISMG